MRVHLAIAVTDVEASIAEYSKLVGVAPEVVVAGQYALFRTPVLNLSIRKTDAVGGPVRHIGFERDDAVAFSEYRDQNGLVWETFARKHQLEEIREAWPEAELPQE